MTNFRPPSFQILPPVIKYLIIFNVVVFIIQQMYPTSGIDNLFALHDIHSEFFRPHQIVTHLFMHATFDHIFLNMLALWMFGSSLENFWGSKRFLNFYMICGIGAALMHLGVLYYENMAAAAELKSYPVNQLISEHQADLYVQVNAATVGASGAVFGCLAAFGYLFPNSLIYIYFLIPIKAKWVVLGYAAIELMAGLRNSAGDNVAHWAHLGGALVGIILVLIWNKTDRRNFY